MSERPFWKQGDEGLALLETEGGPFERSAFRRSYVAAVPGSRDLSFGALGLDGTVAAIALIGRRFAVDSVPAGYGGIQASRPLSRAEENSFLDAARRHTGAPYLSARALAWSSVRTAFATARAVHTSETRRYSRLARRSLRKAESAGAVACRSSDSNRFLDLYRAAAAHWSVRYPEALIQLLAKNGAGIFHDVELHGEVVSSVFTLVDGAHWMCWLAAQNERGRSVAASYLAYDAVLEEASNAVEFVNLGASAPGSGGAQFKSHLGAVEVPMVAWRNAAPGLAASRSVLLKLRGLRSRFS